MSEKLLFKTGNCHLNLCFSQRLKNWEIRERKKARDYSKEAEREEEKHREMVKLQLIEL